MKRMIDFGLRLAFVCAVAAGILAYVYQTTSPIIEEGARREKINKLRFVLPEAERVETRQIDGREVTLGYAGQEMVAVALETVTQGYGGPIRLLVGVSSRGSRRPTARVMRVSILSDKETPGLGKKINDYWFRQQFAGKNAEQIQLKKDSPHGAIDAVSAATISSRAVTSGVHQAVKEVEALLAAGSWEKYEK